MPSGEKKIENKAINGVDIFLWGRGVGRHEKVNMKKKNAIEFMGL